MVAVAILTGAAVGFQMFSTTSVELPTTTFPKFIVDRLSTNFADDEEAACETPDNKVRIKQRSRALQGVRNSFTDAFLRAAFPVHATGDLHQLPEFPRNPETSNSNVSVCLCGCTG